VQQGLFSGIGARRRRSTRVRTLGSVVTAAVVGLPLAVMATSSAPTPAFASGSPITIAYITSVTGEGGAEDGTSPAGFEARLDMQNAEGGVDGHKLVPLIIDDQTNPSLIATAVQEADSKAFAIVSQSPLFFLAAKYPQQAGVPVTGSYSDGPEWGEQPYTNMFASDNGSVDPKYPVNTQLGSIIKHFGGSVLGAYGYGISPSSSRAAIATGDSFTHEGGKTAVVNTSIPFGSVDFTSVALTAKQDGVNSLSPEMDSNSNYALAEALEQSGVKLKAAVYATGYEPDVIKSPAWKSLDGGYFLSLFRPWLIPNAGTEQMQAAMEKYAHFTKSDFPSFSQYEAWAGADLMIKGLELAGPNPTHANVIKDLRNLKSYNANGLLPQSLNYSTIFGHDPAEECAWVVQATTTGFKMAGNQAYCGKDLPGTSTANAS
jgi:branched-chain amino acid transport system substrate-binding protein